MSDLPRNEDGTPNLDVFTRGNNIIVHHTDITGRNELTPNIHTENAIEAALPNVIRQTSGIREQNVEVICGAVMQKWREIQIEVVLKYDAHADVIMMIGGDRTERIEVD